MSQIIKYEQALSLLQDMIGLLQEKQPNQKVVLTMPHDANWLSNRAEKLKKNIFSIIVTGGFNSGKSTLVNALILEKVLHDGATPTTSVITRLMQGLNYQAKLVYNSDSEEILDWDDYLAQKTPQFKPEEVSTLDICIPSPILAAGIEIIDTPGLNDHESRTKIVLDYLPNADAIILVIDAIQPLRRDDVEFIKLLGNPPLENVFFVTNRMSLLQNKVSAQQDVIQHVQRKLGALLKPKSDSTAKSASVPPRLFFTDARAVLEQKDSEALQENNFDFAALKQELIAFLDIEHRQIASITGLVQDLTELCYKIEQRYGAIETAFAQPLAILQQRYQDSQLKLKNIQNAHEKIAYQLLQLAQEIGEGVYISLLSYIDKMEKDWPDDVKNINFSALENLNVFSVKISEKEKNRLSESLSAELEKYLDLKLLQWLQDLPAVITPILENLNYKISRDVTSLGIDIAELENGLADNPEFSNKAALNTNQQLSLPIQNFITDSIKDIVQWPYLESVHKNLRHPSVLKTVGLSTLSAILAAGAALFGANPLGRFVTTLGDSLVQILKSRQEQQEYRDMMREEVNSNSALKGLNQKNLNSFQQAVKAALEAETGQHFFEELRKQVFHQKQKLIDGVASEIKLLAEHMKTNLNFHLTKVNEQHRKLLESKQAGEQVAQTELTRLRQFKDSYKNFFDAYCQLVLNEKLSEEEIKTIGETRARYFNDYVRMGEKTPSSFNNPLIEVEPLNETPPYPPKRDKVKSYQIIQLSTQAIVARILELDPVNQQQFPKPKQNARAELESLVGIQNVKDSIKEHLDYQETQIRRKQEGKGYVGSSLHMVFTGNPGTGKTTVARLIGEIYREIGLLKKGHTIEVKIKELVAGYVGQTPEKVNKVIESALDGVLFIDEAYALVPKNPLETNFGKEVINVLLDAMEFYRDRFVVIIAGYHDEIQHLLDSDPGLRGRFPLDNHFHFPNYSPEELYQILESKLSDGLYTISEDAKTAVQEVIAGYYDQKHLDKTFENARFVRSFFESLVRKLGARINRKHLSLDAPIEEEDISEAYESYRTQVDSGISMPTSLKNSAEHPDAKEYERKKMSDQEEIQKNAILQQMHNGSGDNVYRDKIVFETKEKKISRELSFIPSSDSKSFFGYADVMEKIQSAIALHNRVLVHSISGRGKTSICTQFINDYNYTQDFQHIAWLSCKTSVAQAFLENEKLLPLLEMVLTDNSNIQSRFQLLQSKLREKITQRTLIVIDSVEKKHEPELEALSLPPNFKILITSRERIAFFEPIEIPGLDFAAAKLLFQKESNRTSDELNDHVLKEIFHLVDHHPTAIKTLAKRFSISYGQTLEAFYHDLKLKNFDNSISELLNNIIDAHALSGGEQTLMRYFSILPSAHIPYDVLYILINLQSEEIQYTVSSLIDKGLLDNDANLGLKCQQIIQEAIRKQLNPDVHNCGELLLAMGEKLSGSMQGNYRDVYILASRMYPLLENVVQFLQSDSVPFNHIFKNLGLFANILGDFEQAKFWIKNSLEINHQLGDTLAASDLLQIYADICQSKGDYDEAEEILNTHIRKIQLEAPQESKELGLAYEKLGMLNLRKGKLSEAIDNLREAVGIYEKLEDDALSPEHVASTGTNLGLALVNLGMADEAIKVLEEASAHYENTSNYYGLGHVCHYLSIAHIALGEIQKALLLLTRAKKYLSGELPEDELIFAEFKNNATIITLSGMANEDSSLDNSTIEEMINDQSKAIQILEHHRPAGHPDFAPYYFNLAKLHHISGSNTLARECLRKSIDLLEQNSEKGKSLNLANFHFMIVTQFENLLNFTETKSHLESAIKALPEKEEYQGHLATFYLLLGANNAGEENYPVAEKDFKQSLKIYRQLFPEDHPIHAFVLHYIATCKRSIGQYQKALEVQTEVLQVCKSFMQETDPDMAFPYAQMALINYDLKNYKEALYFKEKARFVNDGSTDLSELNQLGQIRLIQYLKNKRTYYAYLIVLHQGQQEAHPIIHENLILAEQTNLDEALKLSQDITNKYGSYMVDI